MLYEQGLVAVGILLLAAVFIHNCFRKRQDFVRIASVVTISSFTNFGHPVENEFGCGGPDEGLWILVVGSDVIVNGADEFVDVPEYSAADALLGNFRKPSLHLIKPGAAGGREMEMVAGVLLEPRSHFGRLVSGIVIQDQVYLQGRLECPIDLIEEAKKAVFGSGQ